jgi:hypothetical protein
MEVTAFKRSVRRFCGKSSLLINNFGFIEKGRVHLDTATNLRTVVRGWR